MSVPQEAIDAATRVLDEVLQVAALDPDSVLDSRPLATLMLEAAAPHMGIPQEAIRAITQAVTSERERIRQLAEKHQATYDERTPCNCGRTDCTALVRSRVPFASLLEVP